MVSAQLSSISLHYSSNQERPLLSEDLQMEIVFLLTSLIPGSTSNLISNLYFGLDKFSAINSNADISRKRNIEVNRWVYWIIYALIKFILCVRVRVAGESVIDIFKLFLQLLWIIHEREFYMKSFLFSSHWDALLASPLPPSRKLWLERNAFC